MTAVLGKNLHFTYILFPVVLVQIQWLLLGGTLNVWFILQQLLNPQQNGSHSDVGLPVFLLVQDGEAHCSRGINVGMGDNWLEDTFGWSKYNSTYLTG